MKILSVMTLLVVVFHLSACNTWAGFGKDLQRSGKAIERAGNK